MPHGRLTQSDRRQIAQGLADDLSYAEIARRLERPTSTITREVMRNGGPLGYRADQAHHATERRARRSRPSAGSSRGRTQRAEAAALADYEERFAAVLMAQGLPRMTARVLTSLYTAESGSLSAAELADRLRISPASVSKAVTFLEGLALVRKQRDGRRDKYLVDDDLFYQSTLAGVRANQQFASTAREGVEIVGAGTQAARRLENVARFLDLLSASILQAAEEARQQSE